MQNSIRFTNPGEIDVRLITTMGVNVKDNDSPIGYFGTGLKYAIAVCLRHKQEIIIQSGTTTLTFHTESETVRGKEFQFIIMDTAYLLTGDAHIGGLAGMSSRLGFTTELGKNWSLANAYRELHCNCTDEGGTGGMAVPCDATPTQGLTQITVVGDAFAAVHDERDDFLLNKETKTLIAASSGCEIYGGRSAHIYYRGIAIRKLGHTAAYTYNILHAVTLTEDRTLRDPTSVDSTIARALGEKTSGETAKQAILNKGGFEHQLYSFEFGTPADAFYDTLKECLEQQPQDVSDEMMKLYFRREGATLVFEPLDTSPWQPRIAAAIAFVQTLGFDPHEYKLRFVKSLGRGILGRAKDNTIYIAECVFAAEEGTLEETLIEEYIHLRYDVSDFSREIQDRFLKEIIRLGKR